MRVTATDEGVGGDERGGESGEHPDWAGERQGRRDCAGAAAMAMAAPDDQDADEELVDESVDECRVLMLLSAPKFIEAIQSLQQSHGRP